MDEGKLKLDWIGYGQAPRIFINGVWGGASGSGQIVAHMLFRHMSPPEQTTVDVHSGSTTDIDGAVDVSEIMCTMIIPFEEAKLIGEWLVRHADRAMEVAKSGIMDPHIGPMQ